MNLTDLANIGQVIGAIAVCDLAHLCGTPDSPEHERRTGRDCAIGPRTFRQLVQLLRLRCVPFV